MNYKKKKNKIKKETGSPPPPFLFLLFLFMEGIETQEQNHTTHKTQNTPGCSTERKDKTHTHTKLLEFLTRWSPSSPPPSPSSI